MSEIIDFESERLKRLLELELRRWGCFIEDMTPDELEAAIDSLKTNRIDEEGIKPEEL